MSDERRDQGADEALADEQELEELRRQWRASDRTTNNYLKERDEPSSARQRGYSHGSQKGEGRRGHEVLHLTPEHWQNVGGFGLGGDLSDQELDEERRGEGAISDQRPDGDIVVTIRLRGINPRSWMNGWDAEAQAAYLARPAQSKGAWDDQAWRRYIAHKQRTLPPMRACVVCGETFQPERTTRRYCKNACSQRAKRERARQAKSVIA